MNINWANVFNWLPLLKCFVVGGLICVIGQILIDKTKLTPARILVIFVTTGAILGGLGIYKYLVDFAGAGATVPLTGFGYNLAKGAIEGVARNPEASGSIRSTLILGCALTETTGIYGLLVALLIIFIIGMPLAK